MTAVERKKLIINDIKDEEKNMKKTLTNEKSKQKVLFRYIYRSQLKEKTLDIADIYAIISSKKYEKQVTSLREELIGDTSERELAETDAIINIPVVQTAPGMVVLSLPTSSQQQLEQLRSRVQLFPQLLMAFQSIDGRHLTVLMSYELSDGTLPYRAKDVRLFQQYAFRRAADFVLASTGINVDEDDAALNQQFYVSSDDKAIWNEQVVAVKMDQPTEELTEQTASIMSTPKEHPLEKGVLPGYTQLEMDIAKFNAVCRQLAFSRQKSIDEYLLAVAAACHKAGIDQEVATKCLLNVGNYWDKEPLIRSTMENAYQKHRYGLRNPLEPSLMHQQLMKEFLQRRYVFRRNVVTGEVEYQEKGRYILSWRPLTQEARNDINNAAIDEGIKVWARDMDRLIGSSQVNDYDPVREWLGNLPEWDGRDRLGEMADRVPTLLPNWRDNFKVWMRSMVSQWTSGAGQMYGAQMVMMFTGAQGTRKSTFMRMLLPEELRQFYIDRIDFANKKEALHALSRFLLINIDEFDQISKSQTAYLKHLIQRADVKERKMYETTYQQLQRYAAFVATTNSLTPLKDETGSRRYMVVEVTGVIDTSTEGDKAIDYQQLYAQALAEIRRGEDSYFDGERERLIVEMGAEYYEMPDVVSIFCDHFCKPVAGSETLLMSPSEIIAYIHNKWHIYLVSHSNSVELGTYLRKEGYKRGKGKDRRRYYVSVSCQS